MSNASLRERLHSLGLLAAADTLDDVIALATKKRWSHAQLLEHLADIEERERSRRSLERRLSRSHSNSSEPPALLFAPFLETLRSAIDEVGPNLRTLALAATEVHERVNHWEAHAPTRRMPLLDQAIKAHALGMFAVSIPTLIAQFEGLVVEVAGHTGKTKFRRREGVRRRPRQRRRGDRRNALGFRWRDAPRQVRARFPCSPI